MVERFTRTAAGRYNIAHDHTAIVRVDGDERALRWGLLAPWHGHGGKRGPNVYAATPETIAATPFLRKARRAQVLADGWFAWRRIGTRRQPYWIHAPAETTFAAVVATHADDGVESFALVLAPPPPALAAYASAMPVAPGEIAWRADPVDPRLASLADDDPRCVALRGGHPAQTTLF